MKYAYFPIIALMLGSLAFSSCEKLENSVPEEPIQLPPDVVNRNDYYLTVQFADTTVRWESQVRGGVNYTDKQIVGPCVLNANVVSYASNFVNAGDTNNVESFSFFTTKCVYDSADAFTDSVFVLQTYPIQLDYGDSINSFQFAYLDKDTVLWTSGGSLNSDSAQVTHSLTITEVAKSYDALSALEIRGTFTGWLYNPNGDSQLINSAEFFSKAHAY